MDLNLTEEQLAVQMAARDFARLELLPGVIERDEKKIFPQEPVKKMGELGFLGMMVHPQYQGGGMDTISYVLAMEEIAKVDASAAVIMSVNNSLVCWPLEMHGNADQKEKYLGKLATGEILGAYCLSEPEAGSDATAISTLAEDQGEYYLLSGTKNWITNGSSASLYIVFANAAPSQGYKGINAFLVEKAWEGVTVYPGENKLGIRSSDTHSIGFEQVKVPKSHLLGKPGSGFRIAMQSLNGGRIGIAAQALGIASGAYELALQYAQERKAFGQLIARHQAIQFKLAEMFTQIEAARSLCLKAAFLKDQDQNYSQASAMAKLFTSQVAMEVTNEAIQIHGGYGYVKEYHVERMLRDAKITQIYEGTSEMQKLTIAKSILKHIK
ncbi:MAG: acyl-CoA dehydrogenase family protein [Candidatus Cyclobacteriaceae bacterium M3_2C_046]